MAHLDQILSRLPQLYSDGALVRGVIGAPAVQIEIVDELMLQIQRAHWFDTALELDEAARLSAVLDIAPEPWQDVLTFRGWVHALRDAMLREGAVTRRALQVFVAEYVRAFQAATAVQAIALASSLGDPERWTAAPSPNAPALVENPRRRVFFSPAAPNLEPLSQTSVEQRGIDPVMPSVLFVGTARAGESCPVLVNLTTQEALVFTGIVPPGARLSITPSSDGSAHAELEGADVTAQLRSLTGVTPGTPWALADETAPPRALTLLPGKNELWFFPVARYDVALLDRALLALPELAMAEGRWDASSFDASIFYQDPALLLRLGWHEAIPASFEIQLPAQLLLVDQELGQAAALAARAQLGDALGEAVGKLRAAGIASTVELKPFCEAQGQRDRLTMVLPKTFAEGGPVGADRLPDAGGLFEVTPYNDSTFR